VKCIECKSEKGKMLPIFKKGTSCGDKEDYSGKVICTSCLEDSEDYGTCFICCEEGAYHRDDLRSEDQDCCDEHYEILDEEEREDMRTIIDYYADPNHGGD
jgi:hypothetical protein